MPKQNEREEIPSPQSPVPEESKPRKRSWLMISLITILCVGVAYLLIKPFIAPKKEAPKGPRAVPIEADIARRGSIKVYVRALGTVIPLHSVTVVSQVQGQITAVNFREGQFVKKGDSLIEIDPRPFQAAVLQAQGQLDRDRSLARQAEINLKRYKQAYAARAISQQQFSDQQQLVAQTKATVKSDEGVLENAQVNLAYTHITSPLDGQMGLRLVDPGNFVQTGGTQLAVIAQIEPITVIFSVAEDNLWQIQEQIKQKQQMTAEVYDRSLKKLIATGTFLAMDNQIDPNTGTVRIRAIFDNKEHSLFPNQFVNTKLLVTTKEGAILVPTAAIQIGPQGSYVYAIQQDGTAKIQKIKVEITEGDHASVQGLNDGQAIAISGFDKLSEGVHVQIRNKPQQQVPRPSTTPGTTTSPITRN